VAPRTRCNDARSLGSTSASSSSSPFGVGVLIRVLLLFGGVPVVGVVGLDPDPLDRHDEGLEVADVVRLVGDARREESVFVLSARVAVPVVDTRAGTAGYGAGRDDRAEPFEILSSVHTW